MTQVQNSASLTHSWSGEHHDIPLPVALKRGDKSQDPEASDRTDSAIATIQIREIPEAAYEVIRKRARADGRSIQSYMRDWVVDFAAHPTTQEAMVALEVALNGHDTPGATRESIQADLAADERVCDRRLGDGPGTEWQDS